MATPSSAELAATTSNPANCSTSRTSLRFRTLSSTTRIVSALTASPRVALATTGGGGRAPTRRRAASTSSRPTGLTRYSAAPSANAWGRSSRIVTTTTGAAAVAGSALSASRTPSRPCRGAGCRVRRPPGGGPAPQPVLQPVAGGDHLDSRALEEQRDQLQRPAVVLDDDDHRPGVRRGGRVLPVGPGVRDRDGEAERAARRLRCRATSGRRTARRCAGTASARGRCPRCGPEPGRPAGTTRRCAPGPRARRRCRCRTR